MEVQRGRWWVTLEEHSLSRWAKSQRRDALFGKRNYEGPRRVCRVLAPRARTLVAPHRRCAQRSCAIAPALSTHSARDEKTYRAAQRTYRVAGRSARYGARVGVHGYLLVAVIDVFV